MPPFLNLTEHETDKGVMIRIDLVTVIRTHSDSGTQVRAEGEWYWVKESLEDIRAGIREVTMRQVQAQNQRNRIAVPR